MTDTNKVDVEPVAWMHDFGNGLLIARTWAASHASHPAKSVRPLVYGDTQHAPVQQEKELEFGCDLSQVQQDVNNVSISRKAIERTINCLNTPYQADLRIVLRDLYAALEKAPVQQESDSGWKEGRSTPSHGAFSAAPVQQEPVMWQYRFFDSHPDTVTTGTWSEWEEVKPRNPYTDTVQNRVDEFRAYIQQGYKYELRALYAGAAPVQQEQVVSKTPLTDALNFFTEAERVDLWKKHNVSDSNIAVITRAVLAKAVQPPSAPVQQEPVADIERDCNDCKNNGSGLIDGGCGTCHGRINFVPIQPAKQIYTDNKQTLVNALSRIEDLEQRLSAADSIDTSLSKRITELEAQNKQLLEALKRVIDCCDISECQTVPNSPGALKNARAAIAAVERKQ